MDGTEAILRLRRTHTGLCNAFNRTVGDPKLHADLGEMRDDIGSLVQDYDEMEAKYGKDQEPESEGEKPVDV